jgi:hypothetical protein
MTFRPVLIALLAVGILVGCGSKAPKPLDPNTAPVVTIDRFSKTAGTLFVRNATNGLPQPGNPINFDQAPFITQGLGPDGSYIEYYNFDVQPMTPAPIYVLVKKGESDPVAGQLNIIDVIPGETGYNDFWQVVKVTVPADYQANTVASAQAITKAGYPTETTDMLVNCPLVPNGSTAAMRYGSQNNGLTRGWYRDSLVTYFTFAEHPLTVTPAGEVPVSKIYVCFNTNPEPDNPQSGPPSGFMTEPGSSQTHNVASTLPPNPDYSPLWLVNVYDNADFDQVRDLTTAESANILATGTTTVNCPIVAFR